MIRNDVYSVGITGGISTGKSEVTKYLVSNAFCVIDFDEIYHKMLEDDELTKERIRNHFGEKVFTEQGEVNRKVLRDIVFSDKDELEILNSITHGKIYEIAENKIKESYSELIFLDIPLLFENRKKFSEFYNILNEKWVVSCNRDVQIERLMKRDLIDEETANLKINLQMPLCEKEKLADVIIYNNSNIEFLHKSVDKELESLKKRIKIYEEK